MICPNCRETVEEGILVCKCGYNLRKVEKKSNLLGHYIFPIISLISSIIFIIVMFTPSFSYIHSFTIQMFLILSGFAFTILSFIIPTEKSHSLNWIALCLNILVMGFFLAQFIPNPSGYP